MFESKEESQGLLIDEENSHEEEVSVDVIQAQIEQIKQKEAELAQKRQEIQEITQKKEAFLAYKEQVEHGFIESLPLVEDLLLSLNKDLEKLRSTEEEFRHWRSKMKDLRVEEWSNDRIKTSLDDAKSFVSQASQAFEDAEKEFRHSQHVTVFRQKIKRQNTASNDKVVFFVKQGFWFHLPLFGFAILIIIILGLV